MMFLSRPIPVLLLLCLMLTVFWLAPNARAELIINEILGDPNQDWDGDGQVSYRGDEWIEVLNNGASTEDLADFWLKDIFGDNMHLQLSGFLDSGAVAVFYGSDAMLWQADHGETITGFSINNTGDTIELFRTVTDGTGSSLVMIHRVILNNHEVEDDRSSGWDPDTELWSMFDALNPYNGSNEPQGSDCLPTPGELNVCNPLVPVAATSWGNLKSQYR